MSDSGNKGWYEEGALQDQGRQLETTGLVGSMRSKDVELRLGVEIRAR